jgi:hypothetical protein
MNVARSAALDRLSLESSSTCGPNAKSTRKPSGVRHAATGVE